MEEGENQFPDTEAELKYLRGKIEERDEQLVRAAEFGQTLVQKNKTMEMKLKELKEENRTLKDQIEDVNSSIEFLKNQLTSTEQAYAATKKERNQFKAQNDELQNQVKLYMSDSESHQRVLDNNTKLRKQVAEMISENEESKKQLEHMKKLLRESVTDSVSSPEPESLPLSPRTPRQSTLNSKPSESEEIQKLERRHKQKIDELTQQIRSMASDRDIAHIQHRVQLNQMKQENEDLRRELLTLQGGDLVDSSAPQFMTQVREMRMTLARLKRENGLIRKDYLDSQATILKLLGEVSTVMNGISSASSGNKDQDGDGSLEMSYALLQARVIEELGLDDYYTSYGHGQAYPSKEGYLVHVSSWLSSSKKWIKASVGGLTLYNTDKDNRDQPVARYSLIGAKLIYSPSKNDGRFDIKLVPSKTISFDARDAKNKEEWVSFFNNLLKLAGKGSV